MNTKYTFIFKLQKKINIAIKLSSGITFVFSGKLLSHCQTYNYPCTPKYDIFLILGHMGQSAYTGILEHLSIAIQQNNSSNHYIGLSLLTSAYTISSNINYLLQHERCDLCAIVPFLDDAYHDPWQITLINLSKNTLLL